MLRKKDFFSLAAEFFSIRMTLKSSRKLHQDMLSSIMRSKLSFFEATPIGRILNRFSKDMNAIEFTLPLNFKDLNWVILSLLTTFITITTSTPYFLIALVPILIIYIFLEVIYVSKF
jgi:ATP-binding cassette, subfamily C (CFTR/MRP), member 1